MIHFAARQLLVVALAVVACAPAAPAGPSPQATPSGPQRDENQTLRLALTGIVGNPTPQASASATHQLGWLYDSLTLFGPNFEVRPGVAERWEIGPDGLTWRFSLRRDMTWPDGTPL
ncbi:MAG: ABC transporter substrate-binding protein, partial [Dehalococcoidia bacterium]|nr:ABC transporter substrate-binding protein [Dehalococcoidia bacterium]